MSYPTLLSVLLYGLNASIISLSSNNTFLYLTPFIILHLQHIFAHHHNIHCPFIYVAHYPHYHLVLTAKKYVYLFQGGTLLPTPPNLHLRWSAFMMLLSTLSCVYVAVFYILIHLCLCHTCCNASTKPDVIIKYPCRLYIKHSTYTPENILNLYQCIWFNPIYIGIHCKLIHEWI